MGLGERVHASGTFPVHPNSLLRFRTPVNQAFINKASGTIIIGKKVIYDFPVYYNKTPSHL